MALFGRSVVLDVGVPGQPGKRFAGLRVGFRVEMTLSGTPNKARIEVYNVNPDSVATVQNPDAEIRLSVGYDGIPLLIFSGNPTPGGVLVERASPDRILRIEALDGGAALRRARISESFDGEVTAREVFDRLAAALGLPSGVVDFPGEHRFSRGLVLRGDVRSILDRLTAAAGAEWYVRDGALVVLPEGGDTGETVDRFSATSGNLIGSPSPKDDGVEITGLISPTMRPGRTFEVESESINGLFIAREVVFEGDSGYATPFYVRITGRPKAA